MRLATKTTLAQLAWIVPVACIGVLLSFWQLRSLVREEQDEALLSRKEAFVRQLAAQDHPMGSSPLGGFTLAPAMGPRADEAPRDTLLFSPEEQEMVPFRLLRFTAQDVTGAWHQVTLLQPALEEEDLWESSASSLLLASLLFVVALLASTLVLNRRLWRPFRQTLQRVKSFDLRVKPQPLPQRTGTSEFDELNAALNGMMTDLHQDYEQAKEFTANAAHEMQTPLAVSLALSDSLLQSATSEGQFKDLMSLQESVQRVSRLQQGLLLLAKIDHQQFPSTAAVQLAQLVHRKLEEATDLVAAQQFQVSVALDSQARANLHPSLADILVRNLVSNALRHTPAQGRITIELNAGKFVVSNSGEPLSIDEERLFQPFAKARPEGPGLGLGLAIVRRIATSMGGDATYSYQEGMHHFTIHFPPA